MAHKKAGGSTALGRDSNAQRLGVKKFGGEKVLSGNIIVRQKGTRVHPGLNVMRAKNDTLFATANGIVAFKQKKVKSFTGKLTKRVFVSIVPEKKK